MVPKELFLSTIEQIQQQEACIREFNTALGKMCECSPLFDAERQYLTALRNLLKYTMQDKHGYIEWWLYEAPDAGYTILCNDDGKEVNLDLTEASALYDYLSKSAEMDYGEV